MDCEFVLRIKPETIFWWDHNICDTHHYVDILTHFVVTTKLLHEYKYAWVGHIHLWIWNLEYRLHFDLNYKSVSKQWSPQLVITSDRCVLLIQSCLDKLFVISGGSIQYAIIISRY